MWNPVGLRWLFEHGAGGQDARPPRQAGRPPLRWRSFCTFLHLFAAFCGCFGYFFVLASARRPGGRMWSMSSAERGVRSGGQNANIQHPTSNIEWGNGKGKGPVGESSDWSARGGARSPGLVPFRFCRFAAVSIGLCRMGRERGRWGNVQGPRSKVQGRMGAPLPGPSPHSCVVEREETTTVLAGSVASDRFRPVLVGFFRWKGIEDENEDDDEDEGDRRFYGLS